MLDFNKIGSTGNTADTLLVPREIFNALPKKSSLFQYPRDVQSQVWEKWFARREEEHLVLKMNTGSGKTVVGLLILKSCLNEKKGPAVYVCPNKHLVEQVVETANQLGLVVATDVHSPHVLSGRAILIVNIHTLVNGMSKFGVGDITQIPIGSLIIDDAHACLNTIEDQFTLTVKREHPLYNELWSVFREAVSRQNETKVAEIDQGDSDAYAHIPYWVWQNNLSNVTKLLTQHSTDDSLKYTWPLIKEDLIFSDCVIGGSAIELSLPVTPIHMVPSLIRAKRKIYLTATLVDDSILSTHFAVEKDFLNKPIVPSSAGDIGDRMILFPQAINPTFSDEAVRNYCKFLSEYINVVVIVPSNYQAQQWQTCADDILNKSNITQGVEQLQNKKTGLTVLINRYDGIDLPHDACRLLVLDGFPDARRLIDKVTQSILMGSDRDLNQSLQKIEQGMGRGVRSNDDYCVVFLMGRTITNYLYSQGAREKLSPGTKAQLALSEQVSDQILNASFDDLTKVIWLCLGRNNDWMIKSKGELTSLQYSDVGTMDPVAVAQRDAYELAVRRDYKKIDTVFNSVINSCSDRPLKGLLKQRYASFVNIYDQTTSQQLQLSAVKDNRRVSKPISGIQYEKVVGNVAEQAALCCSFLMSEYGDGNHLVIEVESILDDLQFKANSSNRFEEAMKKVACFIGFSSQRPEIEFKKGPDNLWVMGSGQYCVMECKNEAVTSTIKKHYCNQLNGSCEWFEHTYGANTDYIPVLVHPAYEFEYSASPNPKIRIMGKVELQRFKDSVRGFIQSLVLSNQIASVQAIREKLSAFGLRQIDFKNRFTNSFRRATS